MSREEKVKKHIDCEWLLETQKNRFICCDSRGQLRDKELNIEEVNMPACKHIHLKLNQKVKLY